MWRKTGYEAQGQQIENAGLNKALMYGGGGASAVSQSQGNSGVNNTGTQAVAMGLQVRAIEAQVSNTEAMGKISNYKTSEYLRSGNTGVEDKNNDKQEEANKNGDERTA